MVIDRRRKFLEDLNLIQLSKPSSNNNAGMPNPNIGFSPSTTQGVDPSKVEGPSILDIGDIARGAISQKIGIVGPDDIFSAEVKAGQKDTLDETVSIIDDTGRVVHTGERSYVGLSSKLRELQEKNQETRYRVINDVDVPNFLDRFRSLDANQKRIIQPLNMVDKDPDIFKRVTSGVTEDVFNQSIVDKIKDVRFDSRNKSEGGKPTIRNFDYYNNKYELDLPNVPFSAYGQGERPLQFFGGNYADFRGYTETGSDNPILSRMFPKSKIAGNIIDKVYLPLTSFVKRKITGSENQRISKAFIDENVAPRIPGTQKTDLENVNDMLFWEGELVKQLESAINMRDKLINSPSPTNEDQQEVNNSELVAYNNRIAELPGIIMANRAMLAKAYETGDPTIQDKINIVQSDSSSQDLIEGLENLNTRRKKNSNRFNLQRRN
ncbi:MAG: hypothetical protein CBD88_00505 [Flavobacteriales bacterium TMED228]|nr:MAG: hypothetical protein CBD88_00505 [Flavobacteriales bacterium TMED228]|tara:strand:+ start:5660 stop:6967 length:1308 start_codon:yes stop_codon:yes gene_type:complete